MPTADPARFAVDHILIKLGKYLRIAFYRCPGCHTGFWKGAHVRNTCRKLGIPWAGDA